MKLIKSLFLFIVVGFISCQSQKKFDPIQWRTVEDPAFPPQSRKAMLKDLLDNYKLKSMSQSQVFNLLGEPDYSSDSAIIYKIVEDYGSDTDPVYTKTLDITLNKDKTVQSIDVQEWRK